MDNVEEIKKKIDIVGLVSSYLTVQKAGRNYRACCPFHKEKTPSFMISPEKQIWYCFGCNQGGDIFSFVEKIEGIDFVGALNLLADRAGVIIDKGGFVKKDEKDKYYKIAELAKNFFSFILMEHPAGQEAKKYLIEKRKLTPETIKIFSLGYAPSGPEILRRYLAKKGYSDMEMDKVGLITKNSQNKIVDKFRDRIVFPIRASNGKVIAFGGRVFKEPKNPSFAPPKYLNSPQSELYDKSAVLYGLYEAREEIREKELGIVVEGYMDVISSHQAGVKNVVASSGTALTEKQVEVLSRYTNSIAFCFDQDEAGQMAMKRALEMTRFDDINVKAIIVKEAKDPDELINKDPSVWAEASVSPVSLLDFYYSSLLKKYSNRMGADDKKRIMQDFMPIISGIANDIERGHWVKKLSDDLGVGEKYILEAMEKFKTQGLKVKSADHVVADEKKNSLRIRLSKEMLLMAALVLYPEKIDMFFQIVKEDDLIEEKSKILYKILNDWHNTKEENKAEISISYIKEGIDSEREKQLDLDLLFFLASGFFDGLEKNESLKDIDVLVSQVIKDKKEKRKKEIEISLLGLDKVAEREKIKLLLRELQNLI